MSSIFVRPARIGEGVSFPARLGTEYLTYGGYFAPRADALLLGDIYFDVNPSNEIRFDESPEGAVHFIGTVEGDIYEV